ncbi:MAG: BatA domain-containing protein [Chitinophagales bacterium]|nr:BatA domain-containing protein [Chitinophagales bacterium]
MSFVYPAFLFAASLIAVPVIVHLFNFRRYKTVYFTNVRFLKEVQEESSSRSRLKHLLVLAARILALLFLVLAFAQPYIPVAQAGVKKEGSRAISVYIDNSFSMSAENEGEALLNKAKQRSRQIVNAYGAAERFQLLTNDFEGRHQRFLTKDEVLSLIDEVKPSPKVRLLKEVLALQKKSFSETRAANDIAYIVSDFQKNAGKFDLDSTTEINLVPQQPEQQQNLYIDTAWFDKPIIYAGQTVNLMVKITNDGEQPIENSRLSLNISGKEKALGNFSVQPNATITDMLSFTVQDTGWQQAVINLIDNPITFDDQYFLAYKSIGQINVMAVSPQQADPYLNALFAAAEKFNLNNVTAGQIDYSKLANHSMIVLKGLPEISSGTASELENYIANGGVVVVFPDVKANIATYNQFFGLIGANPISRYQSQAQPITYLNKEHSIYKDVFEEVPDNMALPTAKGYFTFGGGSRSTEQKLLGFRDGNTFLSQYTHGSGMLFVCASPLDKEVTDFPLHGLFAPLLYKMSVMGGQVQPVAYTLGEDKQITIPNVPEKTDAVYKMRSGEEEFVPQQRRLASKMLLSVGDRTLQAGVFGVIAEKATEALVAFNYNRSESKLAYYTLAELQEMYASKNVRIIDNPRSDIGSLVKELDQGIVLWKLCIIFALVFVAIEVLLLRFLK